jgi:hypothetical protein
MRDTIQEESSSRENGYDAARHLARGHEVLFARGGFHRVVAFECRVTRKV